MKIKHLTIFKRLNCYMGSSENNPLIYSLTNNKNKIKNTQQLVWFFFFSCLLFTKKQKNLWQGTTYLQTTQANPISMAKSSALVSSKLERSAIAKSLLVWTVMGEDRVSGFSNLGFFGISTPSVMSDFIYKNHPIRK